MKEKWNREMKIKEAQAQMCFTTDGSLKHNESKLIKVEAPKIDFTKNVTCPFCLSWLPLGKFLISTKKGYNQGTGHCPICDQKMKMKTLFGLGKWTPEQYAQFITEYPTGAFWKKVKSFEEWKKRLSLMKWSQPFWNEYKRLNPKMEDEKPTEEEEDLYKAQLKNTEKEVY